MEGINILGIDKNELSKKYLITLDTNVILDIYRKSNNFTSIFLSILNDLKSLDVLWIPNHVRDEFLKNKISTLKSSKKKLEKINKLLITVGNEINTIKESPFANFNDLRFEYNFLMDKINSSILNTKNNALFNSDDYLDDKINEIFNGIYGKGFTELEFKDIYKEGEKRYDSKIPPGFNDSSKYHLKERYGDLIIWFELIEISKKVNKNIIFITGDLKDDWWEIDSNGTKVVKPELKIEFSKKTSNNFLLLNIDDFLQLNISRKHIISQYKKNSGLSIKYKVKEENINFSIIVDNLLSLSKIENNIIELVDNNLIKKEFEDIGFRYISFSQINKRNLLKIETLEIESKKRLTNIDRLITNYFEGENFQEVLDNLIIYKKTLNKLFTNLRLLIKNKRIIKK